MQYSVVSYKKLNDTLSFRLDAGYFRPSALLYEDRINKLHSITVKEYGCKVVSGPFGSSLKSEAYLSSGIPFIRISDLKDFQIDTDELIYISKNDHNRLSSSKLNVGDLVLSKVGNTIGVVSRVTDDVGECNISENNIGIKFPKNIPSDEKIFILTFLNSEAGQSQILRSISGNAQPKLNISDIETIKIPRLSDEMKKHARLLIDESYSSILKSKQFYKEAEQILLSELGLLNWKLKSCFSFIKNFSNAKTTHRFDAEYFQPMYEEILGVIKKYKSGCKTLVGAATIKDKNFIPKNDVSYKYIELSNISANGNITGFTQAMGKELPSRARRKVSSGDVIVSSIEGSLSSIALITNDLDGFLCSTGFFVVKSDDINSETLLVLLKSPVGQLQLKRGCSGSILTAIGKDEFERIVLPDISAGVQEEIKQKITEMYNAKACSKRLLEIAKRGVEITIEKNEQTAMEWINRRLEG